MYETFWRDFCVALIMVTLLSGCSEPSGLDPKHPVTLTLWHNFGGQMQATMDALVDEFNGTVGKENGVILSVTSISGSASVQEKLTMIAAGDPGAPEMPDITTCYPATASILRAKELLAPLDGPFTQEELDAYLPRFVEEGRLDDGRLYVFPFAKSTEVLFVNQTLFDRFSQAVGVTLDSLSTFEGIAAASMEYYQWTDGLTPDTAGDGKHFYTADSLFNLAQVGMEQMGASLLEERAWRWTTRPTGGCGRPCLSRRSGAAMPSTTATPPICPKPGRSSAPPVLPRASSFMGIRSPTRTTPLSRWSTPCCPSPPLKAGRKSLSSGAMAWWWPGPPGEGAGRGAVPQVVHPAGAEHALCGLHGLSPGDEGRL